MSGMKTNAGNFFEDFTVGQVIEHATPRTITEGDRALYGAIYPTRFAVAVVGGVRRVGRPGAPPGRGAHRLPRRLRQDRAGRLAQRGGQPRLRRVPLPRPGRAGRHAAHPLGGHRPQGELQRPDRRRLGALDRDQPARRGRDRLGALGDGAQALGRRRRPRRPSYPTSPPRSRASDLVVPAGLDFSSYDVVAAGSPHLLGDYEVGERIDHVDGVTLTDAEHMMATRLWQNTAKVHFNTDARPDGRRLVYGGHVISLARALSFNGLANAQLVAAINAGAHVAPAFAGDTVHAWSEVLDIGGARRPRRRRAAAAAGRDQGARRVDDAARRGREVRRRRAARPGLLGARPALSRSSSGGPARRASRASSSVPAGRGARGRASTTVRRGQQLGVAGLVGRTARAGRRRAAGRRGRPRRRTRWRAASRPSPRALADPAGVLRGEHERLARGGAGERVGDERALDVRGSARASGAARDALVDPAQQLGLDDAERVVGAARLGVEAGDVDPEHRGRAQPELVARRARRGVRRRGGRGRAGGRRTSGRGCRARPGSARTSGRPRRAARWRGTCGRAGARPA